MDSMPDAEALVEAARSGHVDEVKRLLGLLQPQDWSLVDFRSGKGAQTPLMAAARGGHVEVVSVLLAAGAAVDARDPSGRSAVMLAAAEGKDEIVELVIKQHVADVSFTARPQGHTALMLAASAGHLSTVEALLRYAPQQLVNARGADGETGLWLACAHGHAAVAR